MIAIFAMAEKPGNEAWAAKEPTSIAISETMPDQLDWLPVQLFATCS
jgi:hypothetical protein